MGRAKPACPEQLTVPPALFPRAVTHARISKHAKEGKKERKRKRRLASNPLHSTTSTKIRTVDCPVEASERKIDAMDTAHARTHARLLSRDQASQPSSHYAAIIGWTTPPGPPPSPRAKYVSSGLRRSRAWHGMAWHGMAWHGKTL